MKYVIYVQEKEKENVYVQIDPETGKGMPVADPSQATILDNKLLAKAVLKAIRPIIEKAQPGVLVGIQGI